MPVQPSFEDLVKAVIGAESSGRSNVRGKKGEIGLMQIMPRTAGDYGITDPNRLLDPRTNKDVGSRFLTDLLKHYKGDLTKTLEAYNAGRSRVDKGRIPLGAMEYANKVEGKLAPTSRFSSSNESRKSEATVGSQTPRFSPNMMFEASPSSGGNTLEIPSVYRSPSGGGLREMLMRAISPASAEAADTLEIPRVGPRATKGIPIPPGAKVGGARTGPIAVPPGATVGTPPTKPMSTGEGIAGAFTGQAIGKDPVAAADYLPLVGQSVGAYGGETAGAAMGGPVGAAVGAGAGGGVGEGVGEEIDTGVRALAGKPYRSQSEIAKNAGYAALGNAATVPGAAILGKVGHAVAPTTLKAAIAAKAGFRASREALEATMKKINDLLGMDAKAAAAAAQFPAERRAVRAAYVGARQAGFERLGSEYNKLLGKYLGRVTPNRSGRAYVAFRGMHGAQSLPLLAGNTAIPKGVDFTNPTVKMIQLFRSNVRKMIRRLGPDQRAMAGELFKLDRSATNDIKAVMSTDDVQHFDLIDQTYADYASNLPEKQLRAIMRAPNSPAAVQAIIKSDPSQLATLLRQFNGMRPAEQIKHQFALKKAIGEWIHDQTAGATDYASSLKSYAKAINDVPDIVWSRLYWAGAKEQVRLAAEETVKFHEKMLDNPEMIPAIIAAMKARPVPWFVERAKSLGIRGAEWGLVYGLWSGDFRESATSLVVGFTPAVLHKIANNRLTEQLYLKMVTARNPAAIGAALRDLITALVAQQFRGPVRDEDGKPASVSGL